MRIQIMLIAVALTCSACPAPSKSGSNQGGSNSGSGSTSILQTDSGSGGTSISQTEGAALVATWQSGCQTLSSPICFNGFQANSYKIIYQVDSALFIQGSLFFQDQSCQNISSSVGMQAIAQYKAGDMVSQPAGAFALDLQPSMSINFSKVGASPVACTSPCDPSAFGANNIIAGCTTPDPFSSSQQLVYRIDMSASPQTLSLGFGAPGSRATSFAATALTKQ